MGKAEAAKEHAATAQAKLAVTRAHVKKLTEAAQAAGDASTVAAANAQKAASDASDAASVAKAKAAAAEAKAVDVSIKTDLEDKKVAALEAGAATKKSEAAAATKKAESLASGASKAAIDAQRASAKAEAEAAAAKKVEEKNDLAVAVEQHKAHDAEAGAKAAQAAAKAASDLASGVAKKLHDAKCENNAGCSTLVGYCCPTFNVALYHLGGEPQWGGNLGCCGAGAETERAVDFAEAQDDQLYNAFSMILPMAISAAFAAAVTWKIKGRADAGARYHQFNDA